MSGRLATYAFGEQLSRAAEPQRGAFGAFRQVDVASTLAIPPAVRRACVSDGAPDGAPSADTSWPAGSSSIPTRALS